MNPIDTTPTMDSTNIDDDHLTDMVMNITTGEQNLVSRLIDIISTEDVTNVDYDHLTDILMTTTEQDVVDRYWINYTFCQLFDIETTLFHKHSFVSDLLRSDLNVSLEDVSTVVTNIEAIIHYVLHNGTTITDGHMETFGCIATVLHTFPSDVNTSTNDIWLEQHAACINRIVNDECTIRLLSYDIYILLQDTTKFITVPILTQYCPRLSELSHTLEYVLSTGDDQYSSRIPYNDEFTLLSSTVNVHFYIDGTRLDNYNTTSVENRLVTQPGSYTVQHIYTDTILELTSRPLLMVYHIHDWTPVIEWRTSINTSSIIQVINGVVVNISDTTMDNISLHVSRLGKVSQDVSVPESTWQDGLSELVINVKHTTDDNDISKRLYTTYDIYFSDIPDSVVHTTIWYASYNDVEMLIEEHVYSLKHTQIVPAPAQDVPFTLKTTTYLGDISLYCPSAIEITTRYLTNVSYIHTLLPDERPTIELHGNRTLLHSIHKTYMDQGVTINFMTSVLGYPLKRVIIDTTGHIIHTSMWFYGDGISQYTFIQSGTYTIQYIVTGCTHSEHNTDDIIYTTRTIMVLELPHTLDVLQTLTSIRTRQELIQDVDDYVNNIKTISESQTEYKFNIVHFPSFTVSGLYWVHFGIDTTEGIPFDHTFEIPYIYNSSPVLTFKTDLRSLFGVDDRTTFLTSHMRDILVDDVSINDEYESLFIKAHLQIEYILTSDRWPLSFQVSYSYPKAPDILKRDIFIFQRPSIMLTKNILSYTDDGIYENIFSFISESGVIVNDLSSITSAITCFYLSEDDVWLPITLLSDTTTSSPTTILQTVLRYVYSYTIGDSNTMYMYSYSRLVLQDVEFLDQDAWVVVWTTNINSPELRVNVFTHPDTSTTNVTIRVKPGSDTSRIRNANRIDIIINEYTTITVAKIPNTDIYTVGDDIPLQTGTQTIINRLALWLSTEDDSINVTIGVEYPTPRPVHENVLILLDANEQTIHTYKRLLRKNNANIYNDLLEYEVITTYVRLPRSNTQWETLDSVHIPVLDEDDTLSWEVMYRYTNTRDDHRVDSSVSTVMVRVYNHYLNIYYYDTLGSDIPRVCSYINDTDHPTLVDLYIDPNLSTLTVLYRGIYTTVPCEYVPIPSIVVKYEAILNKDSTVLLSDLISNIMHIEDRGNTYIVDRRKLIIWIIDPIVGSAHTIDDWNNNITAGVYLLQYAYEYIPGHYCYHRVWVYTPFTVSLGTTRWLDTGIISNDNGNWTISTLQEIIRQQQSIQTTITPTPFTIPVLHTARILYDILLTMYIFPHYGTSATILSDLWYTMIDRISQTLLLNTMVTIQVSNSSVLMSLIEYTDVNVDRFIIYPSVTMYIQTEVSLLHTLVYTSGSSIQLIRDAVHDNPLAILNLSSQTYHIYTDLELCIEFVSTGLFLYEYHEDGTTTCSLGGDPYVYPIHGVPVCLPNVYCHYRLLQFGDFIVNGLVDRPTDSHQQHITEQCYDYRLRPDDICLGQCATFLHKIVVINRKQIDQDHTVIDMYSKTICGKRTPVIGPTYYTNKNLPGFFGRDTVPCICIPIIFQRFKLCLYFSKNTQIHNGISIHLLCKYMDEADGLLIKNYRPKLMSIPSLVYTDDVIVHKKHKRQYTKRAIKRRGEYSIGYSI